MVGKSTKGEPIRCRSPPRTAAVARRPDAHRRDHLPCFAASEALSAILPFPTRFPMAPVWLRYAIFADRHARCAHCRLYVSGAILGYKR